MLNGYGYWSLVIGYWLLVIGYWLLVIGHRAPLRHAIIPPHPAPRTNVGTCFSGVAMHADELDHPVRVRPLTRYTSYWLA